MTGKVFNVNDAVKMMVNITEEQAVVWAKEATKQYARYVSLGMSSSNAHDKAVEDASYFVIRKYGRC